MCYLAAQPIFQPHLQTPKQVNRTKKIHNQTIPDDLGKHVFTCDRLEVLPQHNDGQVSGTKVNTNMQRSSWHFYP
jgi:hypothetical protein